MTALFCKAKTIKERLGVPIGSIPLFIAQGRIPQPVGRMGHAFVWLESDIDAWLKAHQGTEAQS